METFVSVLIRRHNPRVLSKIFAPVGYAGLTNCRRLCKGADAVIRRHLLEDPLQQDSTNVLLQRWTSPSYALREVSDWRVGATANALAGDDDDDDSHCAFDDVLFRRTGPEGNSSDSNEFRMGEKHILAVSMEWDRGGGAPGPHVFCRETLALVSAWQPPPDVAAAPVDSAAGGLYVVLIDVYDPIRVATLLKFNPDAGQLGVVYYARADLDIDYEADPCHSQYYVRGATLYAYSPNRSGKLYAMALDRPGGLNVVRHVWSMPDWSWPYDLLGMAPSGPPTAMVWVPDYWSVVIFYPIENEDGGDSVRITAGRGAGDLQPLKALVRSSSEGVLIWQWKLRDYQANTTQVTLTVHDLRRKEDTAVVAFGLRGATLSMPQLSAVGATGLFVALYPYTGPLDATSRCFDPVVVVAHIAQKSRAPIRILGRDGWLFLSSADGFFVQREGVVTKMAFARIDDEQENGEPKC